ncbi:hypothetical protein PRIPAC_76472 [Pristionchus pacificus]|uniref:Uncharacterized protein n=1 Tax=Pristionchus pacificus TaxID=54126 RepID=A0A2A6D0C8_PRIPA|nr:hypothetical protein PRIPAC_76472 [Pristionchus pacificus]|eukprot:PDM83849.1 hypothetical protein PRIPAC_30336 [Pristionchus pacificus]
MNESKKQRKTKEEIVSILSQYEDVKCCGIRNKRLSVAVPTFIFISSLFIAISSYIIEYEESFFIESVICSIFTFFIVFLTEVACVNSNEIFIIGFESSLLNRTLLPSTFPFTILSGVNTLLSITFCKLLFNVNRDIQQKRDAKRMEKELQERSKGSVH